MKRIRTVFPALILMFFCWSCKKDNTPSIPTYTVPTTYNFANVNYDDQVKLLIMADQIGTAINLGNTIGNVVSSQKLKDMFNNANGYFNDSVYALNASGLKLKDFCSPAAQSDILNYFDSIGLYSQFATAASSGVAGTSLSSADPSRKFLLSPNGVFYSQLFRKTVNGGICGYEIANVYLADSIGSSIDNTTVIPGFGTEMEHHWDQAFGFFGVPVNFPTSTSGLKYTGSYSNQVDAGLHSNAIIMNAFLKGRAAISNKDVATVQEQADILITAFDKLDAASIVQEMKETDEHIDDGDAVAAYGTMSEALGFIRSLKYNTSSKRIITDAQITQLEQLVDNDNPGNPNLYKFVDANVNSADQIKAKTAAIRQFIGTIYQFSAADLALL